MKDPYQTLGVSKSATAEEIKNAYRGLAKKFHPDLNPGNKTAEAQFKDISAAYEILGSPENRAKFDRGEWDMQGAGAGAGASRGGPFYREAHRGGGGRYHFDFGAGGFDESMFEELFGGGARGPRRPRDETYQMEVELRDAILGAEREIHLPSGKRLSVKIPHGSRSGQKLRFSGQGAGGVDVFVELRVKEDPRFHLEGDTLVYSLNVPLAGAVLGREIPVPIPEGQVMLKIPPGSSSGRRFRIPGKGMPAKGARGDLIVEIRIALPETRDPQLEEAIRAWSEKKERSAS